MLNIIDTFKSTVAVSRAAASVNISPRIRSSSALIARCKFVNNDLSQYEVLQTKLSTSEMQVLDTDLGLFC